ncbi:MAG: hypothetical protein JNJ58_11640 [Chitinophagaceae bacterium]|nr:hypothetical protein [Chitinophagaceae bacterium]
MKKLLLFIAPSIVLIVSSCKKKIDNLPPLQTSVVYHQVNLVLNHFVNPTNLNLDIDKDGIVDFVLYMNYGYTNSSSFQFFCNIGSANGHFLSIQPVSAPVNDRIRIYPSGAIQDTLNSIWKSYTFLYHKASIVGTVINEEAIVTNGDVYTAFKLSKNGAYHYGWMRMACLTDYKTVHIKDWAYDTIPNRPIQIGQIQ